MVAEAATVVTLQGQSSASGNDQPWLPPEQAAKPATQSTVLDLDALCVDLESDFAVKAFRHLSEAVRNLTAEHDRRMAALRSENLEMDRQLRAAIEGKSICTMTADKMKPNNAASREVSAPSSSSFAPPTQQTLASTWRDGNHGGEKFDGVDKEPTSPKSPDSRQLKNAHDLEDISREIEGKNVMEVAHRMVVSPKFDSFIGAVIILNTFVMSLELEYNGRVFKDEILEKCSECNVRNQIMEGFFDGMEHVFTTVFALELVMRLVTEGCRWWCSVSNSLDGLIVLVSMVDSWILGPMGSNVLGNVAVLRLIRLLRLAKVLRVVRVMKEFKSLRVLVAAVVNSVGALGWSMTLLFVLELVGAIFMAQVIRPFMDRVPGTEEEADLQKFIWNSFGTWTNAMFTIFEITMAPGGFIKYRRLYEEVHALFGAFFVLYVCVVTFAVVRVITAMFLKATLSASDSEDRDGAQQKSEHWSKYIKAMKTPESGDGEEEDFFLTIPELEGLLKIEHFEKWLHEVGLSRAEVLRMFSALGQGSNKVLLSEFAHAMQQMSGVPRAANSILNLYETRDILSRVTKLEARLSGLKLQ